MTESEQPPAGDTRERILSAAHELAIEEGFRGFTIEKVAKRAGVSRMTVYYQFGTRPQLLDAMFDRLAGRGGIEGLREVFGEPDPLVALGRFIDVFCGFWASDRIGLRRLRGWMATENPEEDPVDGRDSWRREALRPLLGRIQDAHGVPPADELDDAIDVLHALTSFETYDRLVAQGRSEHETARLMERAARAVLGLGESSAGESA